MSKIHIKKIDSAASVISRVVRDSDSSVTIYIPKDTKFSKSRNNFILLKREARSAKKEIFIESVDDDVLELASMSGIKAENPFSGKKKRAVSDIVSISTHGQIEHSPVVVKKKKRFKFGRNKVHVVDDDNGDEKKDDLSVASAYFDNNPIKKTVFDKRSPENSEIGTSDDVAIEDDSSNGEELIQKDNFKKEYISTISSSTKFSRKNKKKKKEVKEDSERSSKLKRFFIFSGFGAVIVVALFVAITVLPQVKISLNFEKTNWDFVGSLDVSSLTEESSFTNERASIRGVSFSGKNTLSKKYPATGSSFVKQKAQGIITITNDFSSKSQVLVKTTRFETPDGKIYRLDEGVTVPGAKTSGGSIVPSTIDVNVTADKSGEEYNIGPVTKFTIPGFAGTSRFDGFYGESSGSMAGGSDAERKAPTEEDIDSAREDIGNVLEGSSKSQLLLNLPPDLKVLDGSYNFSIINEDVSQTADDNGMFTITAVGESKLIGFKEEELLGIFKSRVENDAGVDMSIKEFTVLYNEPEVSEDGEGFTVALNFSSVWTRPFDVDQFISSAIGLDEAELKSLIFSVPGVSGGEVRFWPFWVRTVPENVDRIIVDVK